jgi:uncharacterized membrane protein (UPF0127 family)
MLKTFLTLLFITFSGFAQAVDFPQSEITIIHQDGRKTNMTAEMATTPEQQKQGLMFRKSLAKDRGMLFIFEKEDVIQMWMKNTEIPLDMIFIDKNGVAKKIVKNTTPHSLKTISSDIDVIAVLEINAMMSDEMSINIGDKISHPALGAKTKQ